MCTRYRGSDTLLPARGRKRSCSCLVFGIGNGSDTLLPARGRKPSNHNQSLSSVCSDTLLPARGRKPLDLLPFEIVVIKFRYPSPREGTETSIQRARSWRPCRCSDTLLPARGLIYILLSPHKKPTCNACGLLLFYQRSLTTFTRIFDLPHDG